MRRGSGTSRGRRRIASHERSPLPRRHVLVRSDAVTPRARAAWIRADRRGAGALISGRRSPGSPTGSSTRRTVLAAGRVRQVAAPRADSHMNAYCRFKLALTEDNPTIKPYDEAAWAQRGRHGADAAGRVAGAARRAAPALGGAARVDGRRRLRAASAASRARPDHARLDAAALRVARAAPHRAHHRAAEARGLVARSRGVAARRSRRQAAVSTSAAIGMQQTHAPDADPGDAAIAAAATTSPRTPSATRSATRTPAPGTTTAATPRTPRPTSACQAWNRTKRVRPLGRQQQRAGERARRDRPSPRRPAASARWTTPAARSRHRGPLRQLCAWTRGGRLCASRTRRIAGAGVAARLEDDRRCCPGASAVSKRISPSSRGSDTTWNGDDDDLRDNAATGPARRSSTTMTSAAPSRRVPVISIDEAGRRPLARQTRPRPCASRSRRRARSRPARRAPPRPRRTPARRDDEAARLDEPAVVAVRDACRCSRVAHSPSHRELDLARRRRRRSKACDCASTRST